MNKEEIVVDNGHLIHYLNDHEFYEYDTLYISTLDYLEKLQQENKQLKERIDTLKETQIKQLNLIQEKDNRIDKAIEYLNELGTQDGMIKDYKIDKYIKEDLLEILKGE